MTRKRKNVEQENGVDSGHAEGEYKKVKEEQKDYKSRTFPSKKGSDQIQQDFEKQYGYVGGGNTTDILEAQLGQDSGEKQSPFPTELVTYLRNVVGHLDAESVDDIDNLLFDKCIEEISGQEATLLSFKDACIVVEKVFGFNSYSATLFLQGVCRLKHQRLLDLMFAGCSARTMEQLIFKFSPVTTNQQIEILNKFVDLLWDNWKDALGTQASAFFVRCIVRVCCGLPSKTDNKNTHHEKPNFKNGEFKAELKRLFCRLADLAVDPNVSQGLVQQSNGSLVIQDILSADAKLRYGKSNDYVSKMLAGADASNILKNWKGKESSRVWEMALEGCSDEWRQKLWSLISEEVVSIADDPAANYPLQKLISTVESVELASEICERLIPQISGLLQKRRGGVVVGLIKCTVNSSELQEPLLKELRKFFNASKPSNKSNFLLNVLTFNLYDGKYVDFEKSQIQGSVLLCELLKLEKIKTLSTGFVALTSEQCLKMAQHKIATHVLQAAIKSPTMPLETKLNVVNLFQDKWELLMSHPISSHVFDTIWDSNILDLKTRHEMVKKFIKIRNTSRYWQFAMRRCQLEIFRKDIRTWMANWKNQQE